jgi:F-type H+-transporting ATPase subunit h
LPADLASELAAYDAAEPISDAVVHTEAITEEGATGAEAFLSFLEQDEPEAAQAHH